MQMNVIQDVTSPDFSIYDAVLGGHVAAVVIEVKGSRAMDLVTHEADTVPGRTAPEYARDIADLDLLFEGR